MKNLKLKMKKGFTPTPVLPSLRFFENGVSLSRIFSQDSRLAMRPVGAIKQWQNRCRGFTLLEALVAIAILLIAVVGPMSTIGGSLSQSRTARDQVIATNLAQEGIEVVRQKRDSNMLACWGSFTSSCATWGSGLTEGNYIVDATTATLILNSDEKVYLNGSNFYTQGSVGTATQFSRTVNISGSGVERVVTSTVTWSVGGTTKKVEVKESIFGINS